MALKCPCGRLLQLEESRWFGHCYSCRRASDTLEESVSKVAAQYHLAAEHAWWLVCALREAGLTELADKAMEIWEQIDVAHQPLPRSPDPKA